VDNIFFLIVGPFSKFQFSVSSLQKFVFSQILPIKKTIEIFQIFFKILSKWLPSAAILNELFLRKSLACPAAYGGRHPSGATGTWS